MLHIPSNEPLDILLLTVYSELLLALCDSRVLLVTRAFLCYLCFMPLVVILYLLLFLNKGTLTLEDAVIRNVYLSSSEA
jgi:hypothetical protein